MAKSKSIVFGMTEVKIQEHDFNDVIIEEWECLEACSDFDYENGLEVKIENPDYPLYSDFEYGTTYVEYRVADCTFDDLTDAKRHVQQLLAWAAEICDLQEMINQINGFDEYGEPYVLD